jgi:tetratricopeptide (TPR) repeat protein
MMGMKRLIALLAAILLAGPLTGPVAVAQQPVSAETAAERDWLFEALRTAPTEDLGRIIEDRIWRFWMRQAPDEVSATLMNQSMERRQEYDFAGAMVYIDDMVARAPNWAEAWNQRATVLFFQEKFDESLEDVEKVLAIEPKHFGALAGKAVILMQQGRMELGQKTLREAIALHPWLKERRMLLPVPGHRRPLHAGMVVADIQALVRRRPRPPAGNLQDQPQDHQSGSCRGQALARSRQARLRPMGGGCEEGRIRSRRRPEGTPGRVEESRRLVLTLIGDACRFATIRQA